MKSLKTQTVFAAAPLLLFMFMFVLIGVSVAGTSLPERMTPARRLEPMDDEIIYFIEASNAFLPREVQGEVRTDVRGVPASPVVRLGTVR